MQDTFLELKCFLRDVFRLAKENSPAIIFIDEIDAIATKRFDAQTGADREVQRILLELLNQGLTYLGLHLPLLRPPLASIAPRNDSC